MQTRRTLRLLTPLLAAFVAACNINDTEVVGNARQATGSLAPRLVAASGSLTPSDRVLVQLWLKDTAATDSAKRAIDKPWADGSVQLDNIPFNTPWRLKVSGITNGDTLWYGSVNGTLSSTSTAAYSPTSADVLIRNVTPRPSVAPLLSPEEGDTLKASRTDTASKLLVLRPGDSLDCSKATDTALKVPLVAGTNEFRIVACRDGYWPTLSGEYKITAAKRLALSVASLPGLDDTLPFDTILTLRSTTGSGLISSGTVVKIGDFQASDSATARKASVNTTIDLKQQLLTLTPLSASSANLLMVAYLYDGNGLIDSVWRTWKVALPVVSVPTLSLGEADRTDSTLTFHWLHATAGHLRLRVQRGTSWSSDTLVSSQGKMTIAGLATATRCSLSVVAVDTILGRESVPVGLAASTRNRPSVPSFVASNSDTVNGTVKILLTSKTSADTGTTWEVGTGSDTNLIYEDSDTLSTSSFSWSKDFNSGTLHVRVRAIRDGDTVYAASMTSLSVTRTKAAAPLMPTLGIVRYTDSLVWTWTPSPNRGYSLFYKIGSSFSDTSETGVMKDPSTSGRLVIKGLSQGSTVYLRAYAYSTSVTDSAGGLSSPVNVSAKTKAYPASGAITSLKGVQAGNMIKWTWNATTDIKYCQIGNTKFYPSGTAYSFLTSISSNSRTNSVSVNACNADSLCSLTPATASLDLPIKRATIDASETSWEARIVGSDWFIRSKQTFPTPPATLSLHINGGTSASIALDSIKLGRLFPLDRSRSVDTATCQFVWSNGDTSNTVQLIARDLAWPSLNGANSFVAAGATVDTLYTLSVPAPSSSPSSGATRTTSLWSHSKSTGTWDQITTGLPLDGATFPRGLDSIRSLWVVTRASGSVDSFWTTAAVNRTQPWIVTYRNRSQGSVKVVRIGGKTWMAENLNYDIPDDTMDVCLDNDPSKCAAYGRYYTAAQALNLIDSTVFPYALNHNCDTLPNVGKSGSACPTIDPQGVCPTGWHIPTAAEWDALTLTTDGVASSVVTVAGTLYSGAWSSFTGADWFGFDLKPSYAMSIEKNKNWIISGGERSVFWSSTPYQDQAMNGTAFVPNDSYYGSHTMWYYNPLTTPKERSAYSVRCVKD